MGRGNRRKKRMIRIGFAAVFLIVVLALLFIFQIRTVDVYGNSHHDKDEITSDVMNSFLRKNSLYLSWKYRKESVPEEMPYISSLQVKLKSPSHVEIRVTEKEVIGYIDKGEYVYFDREGTVLEMSDQSYEGIPLITGVSTEEAVLYQKLPTESSAQLRTILSLTQLLTDHEINAREIRFGENMDITVFVDNIEANLGQDEYLEEKIANLKKILSETDGKRGTLHLEGFTGKNEAVTFSPSEEPDPTVSDSPEESDNGTAEGTGTDTVGDGSASGADGTDEGSVSDDGTADGGDTAADDGSSTVTIAMVFDSSGTLVYNVHVANGVVVDSNGNPVSGVTVNEDGNVVDAYMNVFDGTTGELIQ